MNSIINHMGKYDHRQHVLSDWLAELEQRFQLGEVNADKAKITWCQLLIGATGSSILAGLEDDASWEIVKETLLSRLGVGSVRNEAWEALKQLKQGSKVIVKLAGEAEKLAKRLHPRDEEAAEHHAIDAFLSAITHSLAAEVQKLGCRTMEEVVAAARRIERILGEQPDSKKEQIILSMQDQIRILTKDLKSAHEQMASKSTAATPTAALAASPAATVAAAQPPPVASPPAMAIAHPPPAAPLPPLATAQPPPYPPGRQLYPDYREGGPYFGLHADSQTGGLPAAFYAMRRPISHIAAPLAPFCIAYCANKLGKPLMAHRDARFLSFLRQKAVKAPPRGIQTSRGSPKAKVTPVGCAVGPPITGQLTLEGIPVHGLVDMGASVTCLGFSVWWRYRAQSGPLRQFEGTVRGAHGKPLQIAGKSQHLDLQWGEACAQACFIVIVSLESPPCLIGMDIVRPLCVHIDVTNGTATPAQPDPQTVHLNAAQQQQQRMKMLLPEVGLPAVGAACPPQTQLQRMKMPLPEVGSPAVGAASPSQLPQQRMEMPLPGVGPPAMGAAYPPHPQQPRSEMPLPEVATPAPPVAKTSPTPLQPLLCPTSHSPQTQPPPRCRFPRLLLPATPLAVLCCCKRQTFPKRWLASFVATARGPPRTFYSVPTTLCRLL